MDEVREQRMSIILGCELTTISLLVMMINVALTQTKNVLTCTVRV